MERGGSSSCSSDLPAWWPVLHCSSPRRRRSPRPTVERARRRDRTARCCRGRAVTTPDRDVHQGRRPAHRARAPAPAARSRPRPRATGAAAGRRSATRGQTIKGETHTVRRRATRRAEYWIVPGRTTSSRGRRVRDTMQDGDELLMLVDVLAAARLAPTASPLDLEGVPARRRAATGRRREGGRSTLVAERLRPGTRTPAAGAAVTGGGAELHRRSRRRSATSRLGSKGTVAVRGHDRTAPSRSATESVCVECGTPPPAAPGAAPAAATPRRRRRR